MIKKLPSLIMARKVLSIILALTFMAALTGCGHQHEWTDATHQNPKTCLKCGKTEGEPIPHEWREANYQEPKTCVGCGETEGNPISPVFLSSGRKPGETGVTYPYKSCYDDKSEATQKITVSEVRVIDGDDYYEPEEGREWVIAHCVAEVSESPKLFRVGIDRTDYYSYDLNTVLPARTINYYGADYKVDTKQRTIQSTGTIFEFETAYLVPEGYDGVILIFYNYRNYLTMDYTNPATVVRLNDIIDEDTLFFRLIK